MDAEVESLLGLQVATELRNDPVSVVFAVADEGVVLVGTIIR